MAPRWPVCARWRRFSDFIGVCFDQILNQAAKFRYMFGGKARAPLVIRMTVGAGRSAAAQHSQIIHGMLSAIPGIKVVLPSNAYDAKGLLLQAIRDEDPVIFLEHKMLYNDSCEVPDGDYVVPFGEGVMLREGEHATVVAMGQMVKRAATAVDALAREGIRCDLIDPRTTSPLDEELILESVRETGRLVVVDEGTPRCGMAADIAALVAHRAFDSLRAPVTPVTAPHTPVPFAKELEQLYLPDAARIEQAIRAVVAH